MCLEEPEITVFHLADDHRAAATIDLPGELIVTWAQLEEAIRWAPHGSRIVIYRAQEIDDKLMRRLAMFTQNHEVLLLCGCSLGVADQLRRA